MWTAGTHRSFARGSRGCARARQTSRNRVSDARISTPPQRSQEVRLDAVAEHDAAVLHARSAGLRVPGSPLTNPPIPAAKRPQGPGDACRDHGCARTRRSRHHHARDPRRLRHQHGRLLHLPLREEAKASPATRRRHPADGRAVRRHRSDLDVGRRGRVAARSARCPVARGVDRSSGIREPTSGSWRDRRRARPQGGA